MRTIWQRVEGTVMTNPRVRIGYSDVHLTLTPMTPPDVAEVITLVTKTRQCLALSSTTYP